MLDLCFNSNLLLVHESRDSVDQAIHDARHRAKEGHHRDEAAVVLASIRGLRGLGHALTLKHVDHPSRGKTVASSWQRGGISGS